MTKQATIQEQDAAIAALVSASQAVQARLVAASPSVVPAVAPKLRKVDGRVDRMGDLPHNWAEGAINWQLVHASTVSKGDRFVLFEENPFVRLCYRTLIGVKLSYKGLSFKVIHYELGGGEYAIVHLHDKINNKSTVCQYLNCGLINEGSIK